QDLVKHHEADRGGLYSADRGRRACLPFACTPRSLRARCARERRNAIDQTANDEHVVGRSEIEMRAQLHVEQVGDMQIEQRNAGMPVEPGLQFANVRAEGGALESQPYEAVIGYFRG